MTVIEEWDFLRNILEDMPPGPYALVFNPEGKQKTSGIQDSNGSTVVTWDWSWAKEDEWIKLASNHPPTFFFLRSYEWSIERMKALENTPMNTIPAP